MADSETEMTFDEFDREQVIAYLFWYQNHYSADDDIIPFSARIVDGLKWAHQNTVAWLSMKDSDLPPGMTFPIAKELFRLRESLPQNRGNPNHGKDGKFSSGSGGGASHWTATAPDGVDEDLKPEINAALHDLSTKYTVQPDVRLINSHMMPSSTTEHTMAFVPFDGSGRLFLNADYFGKGQATRLQEAIHNSGGRMTPREFDLPTDIVGPVKLNTYWSNQTTVGELIKHEYGHVLEDKLNQTTTGKTARLNMMALTSEQMGIDAHGVNSTLKVKEFAGTYGVYGLTNWHEAVAEGFVSLERGGIGPMAAVVKEGFAQFTDAGVK